MSDQDRQALIKLYQEGTSVRQLVDLTGLSMASIYRILKTAQKTAAKKKRQGATTKGLRKYRWHGEPCLNCGVTMTPQSAYSKMTPTTYYARGYCFKCYNHLLYTHRLQPLQRQPKQSGGQEPRCTGCGSPDLPPHRWHPERLAKRCLACSQRSNDDGARIRQNRREQGLCTECGHPNDRPNRSVCSRCQARNTAWKRGAA